MLQQTTVEAVIPYFHKFTVKWPTIKKLSESNIEEIMDAWSGLGYYSRAKNIHKAAKIINKEYNDQIPNNYDELIKLPGIGPYTAGAILTIAYDKKASVIDSNIERIILRIQGIKKPKDKVKKELIKISEELCPDIRSGDYVQAMMDLGSAICRPNNPKCNLCPIKQFCYSYKNNLTNLIPIKKTRKPMDMTARRLEEAAAQSGNAREAIRNAKRAVKGGAKNTKKSRRPGGRDRPIKGGKKAGKWKLK